MSEFSSYIQTLVYNFKKILCNNNINNKKRSKEVDDCLKMFDSAIKKHGQYNPEGRITMSLYDYLRLGGAVRDLELSDIIIFINGSGYCEGYIKYINIFDYDTDIYHVEFKNNTCDRFNSRDIIVKL